jgi:hypothetical protein
MGGVLKSLRIVLPGRPTPEPPVSQSAVESLRSAHAVARVGLWPPPRA